MNDDDRFGARRDPHKESKRSFDASIMIRRLPPRLDRRSAQRFVSNFWLMISIFLT